MTLWKAMRISDRPIESPRARIRIARWLVEVAQHGGNNNQAGQVVGWVNLKKYVAKLRTRDAQLVPLGLTQGCRGWIKFRRNFEFHS